MVRIGYVSDERFVALADVSLEFLRLDCPGPGESPHYDLRSNASGLVAGDLPAGRYRVTLAKAGFGSKRIELELPLSAPYQFRLLRDELWGYVWPKWVRAGEQSEFRIHSNLAYKLELWRYGQRKQKCRTIGWFDEHGPGATIQLTPDGDYSQTGVAWNSRGYSSPHHKQFVKAPTKSGLYYFHAENEAGRFFSFPWIVAPACPQTAIAVLAANITWNAYNNFGGRSNYIHPDLLPETPTVNARLELRRYTDPDHINYDTETYAPLSFERPEPINHIPQHVQPGDPIEGRAACHLAPAEWQLLAWLEQNELAYDLYAETHLHFDQLDLDAYRVLVISTHPEYWSSKMYYRVKEWVYDHGGRLVYLGGNGLNCDVEFLDETRCIYRNDDTRRLRDAEAGLESRFHLRHESEARLLGVVFDDRGIMTAAPYKVENAKHWVFERTGLENGEEFGKESLHQRVPGGASGHETDKISVSSPPGIELLAKGTNPDEGGAEMTLYETSSGGAVFATGSICWPSSLLVDRHVATITENVIRRFRE